MLDDLSVLLHHGRRPSAGERRVIDAILIGVAFLLWYGVSSLLRARRTEGLEAARAGATSARAAALTAVALTWLNPHVYLDTVLLLGSIAITGQSLRGSGRAWRAR